MKTLIRLLMVVTGVCLLMGWSCERDDDDDDDVEKHPLILITVPLSSHFTASFTRSILSEADNNMDLDGPVCQLIQTGSGIDESIGNFDLYLNCCWSSVTGEHGGTECYISDVDGDVLNIKCKETGDPIVFTPDYPYDQTIMCSVYEFAGGTGKFAGATGSVTVECCLKDAAASYIAHNWEGSLTMVLGF
jgi:hypothetical protein